MEILENIKEYAYSKSYLLENILKEKYHLYEWLFIEHQMSIILTFGVLVIS